MSVTAYHFWSPTCRPCTHIKPAIEQLKQDIAEVKWVHINIRDDPTGLTIVHNVKVVPTIVVVVKDNNGKTLGSNKASGTDMMGYHRMLRGAVKAVSNLP